MYGGRQVKNKRRCLVVLVAITVLLCIGIAGCTATNKVTVTFDTLGGNRVSSVKVDPTLEMPELPTPKREGYVFGGWYVDMDCITPVDKSTAPQEDITLYAKWTIMEIPLTFVADGFSNQYLYVPYGSEVTEEDMPSVPEKPGFVGRWERTKINSVTERLTIRAIYSPAILSVVYTVGGEEHARYEGEAGTVIGVPADPTAENGYFFGWYRDADFTVPCEEDITAIGESSTVLYGRMIDTTDMERYFTYDKTSTEVTVTGLTALGKSQRTIVVPTEIDGLPVTAIADGTVEEPTLSFSWQITLAIPTGIKTIGAYAFYGNDLSALKIDEGLTDIGNYAFANTNSIEKIKLPSTVKNIGEGAFSDVTTLTSFSVEENSSLVTIGKDCFDGSLALAKFTLPDSADYIIDYRSFSGSGIAEYIDSGDTNMYSVTDGAVYGTVGEKNALVLFPVKKTGEFRVAEGTAVIGEGAFAECTLSAVTLPEGVVTVEKHAFYRCSATQLTIEGNTLTTIGEESYFGSNFRSVTLPSSVTAVANGAFAESNIVNVTFAEGEGSVIFGEGVFSASGELTSVVLPKGITNVGEKAFFECKKLVSVTFPTGTALNVIDDYAFAYCDALTRVNIPNTVTKVGDYAFFGGEGSTAEPVIPRSLTYVGDYAFSGTKVTSYQANNTTAMEYFGEGAFYNCRNLSQIQLPRAVSFSTVPKYAFYGCSSVSTVVFNGNIKVIDDYAFYGCSGLVSATFNTGADGGIDTIGKSSFEGCSRLTYGGGTSAILPLTLTALGERAFYGCSALTNVSIPKNLTSIPKEGFAYCTNLTAITYIEGCAVTTLGENSFAYCTSLVRAELPSSLSLRTTGGAEKNPFYGCTALTELDIRNNPILSSEDGIIYVNDERGKGIYLYPTGKIGEHTIGIDVSFVDDYAFYGVRSLTNLSFATTSVGEGEIEHVTLVKIGKYAFADSSVTSCNLSYRVYEVDDYAFYGSRLSDLAISGIAVTEGARYDIVNETVASDNSLRIGDYAFANTAITSLEVQKRVAVLGEGAFSDCYRLGSLVFVTSYPNETTMDVILDIGARAFENDSSLTEVTVPSTVKNVGDYAFYNCRNMQSVTFVGGSESLDVGKYAFGGNHYLYTVVLPESIRSLGEGVFYDCTRLTDVVFSATATYGYALPDYGFGACYSIERISIPDYITAIGKSCFENSHLKEIIFLNDKSTANLLTIGERAFAESEYLTNVSFPDRTETIGAHAFYGSGLTVMTVGSCTAEIGDYAFAATALREVTVDGAIVLAGQGIFADTLYLTDATVRGDIPDYTFEGSSLANITLIGEIGYIGKNSFADTPYLGAVTVTATDLTVGERAFYRSGLREITVSDTHSITVENEGFFGTKNLAEFSITTANATVGEFAFAQSGVGIINVTADTVSLGIGPAYDGKNLTEINVTDGSGTYSSIDGVLYKEGNGILVQYPAGKIGAVFNLPTSVQEVSPYAFYGNTNLTTVTIDGTDTVSFGEEAFGATSSSLTLFVEEEKLADYDGLDIAKQGLQEDFGGLVLQNISGNKYEVTGYTGTAKNVIIDGYLRVDGRDYYIVKIGESAFYNKVKVESVTIGEGVSEIAPYAFYGAIGLENLVIGNNVINIKNNAFEGCVSLRNVTFGASLSTIGSYAFYGAKELGIVDLSATAVTEIGSFAFGGCNIKELKLSAKLTSIGSNAFENNKELVKTTVPQSVTRMDNYLFNGCDNFIYVIMESKEVPDRVGDRVFYGTPSGLKIFVPSTSEEKYTTSSVWRSYSSKILRYDYISTEPGFENYVLTANSDGYTLVSYLGTEKDVTVSSVVKEGITVTATGEYVFTHFAEKITFLDGIKRIGSNSFRNATALAEVNLPHTLESIGDYAFYGLENLTAVTFAPDSGNVVNSLKKIGAYAFYGCPAIVEVALPTKVEEVGDYAFYGANLQRLTVGSSATVTMKIGNYAFAVNPDLTQIVFSCAISNIGEGAFYDCFGLTGIYLNSTGSTVAKLQGVDTFRNCDLLCVYLPNEATMRAYRGVDGWTTQYDKNRLVLKSNIAKDITNAEGAVVVAQDGFVISPVSGSGSVASIISYIGDKTVVEFPSSVIVNGVEYTVSRIGREENNSADRANGCVVNDSVTEIIIPSSVVSITADAFRGAKGLTKVSFATGSLLSDVGNYAFAYCDNLQEVSLPKSLVKVGSYAFAYCKNLTTVTVQDRSQYDEESSLVLENYSFTESGLRQITLPAHLTTVADYAFSKCEVLKEVLFNANGKTATIGRGAFSYTAIESISLPVSVANVGAQAFAYANSLRSVYINRTLSATVNSTTTTVSDVFEGVNSPFVKVYVPETAYGLYRNTEGWSAKTVIPDLTATDDNGERYNYRVNGSGSVTSNATTVTLTAYLGEREEIVIPKALNIGNYVCNVTSIDGYFGNEQIKKVTFHTDSMVTNLNEYAFAGCSALRAIVLSDRISGMGERAFENCVSLTDVTLSESLEDISTYAFSGCVSLEEITVPAGIKQINIAAFLGCKSLNRLNILFSEVTPLGLSALTETSKHLVIIVPDGRKDSFKNQWSEYADRIYDSTEKYGDFVVVENGEGLTLVQYNGNEQILDLDAIILGGKKITAVGNDAFPNGTALKENN